jgi:hypothetical protein
MKFLAKFILALKKGLVVLENAVRCYGTENCTGKIRKAN